MSYGDYLRNKYHHAEKTAEAEGVPCVLENSKGKHLRSYRIYGNSVQNGTPSPDTPIEIQSVGDLVTDTASEYYGKYDIPITVRGKNLLPNSDWISGAHTTGFTEHTNVDYITEYTQNSISFNLAAWKGVSSPRFKKDSVKRIIFKINQTALNSDSYVNFYIAIQGYDDNNNKVGNQIIYNNAVADTEYIFDFSTIVSYGFYANSTQFSFCILARKNALSNLMVYDIAYYAETDTAVYEPYKGETKHIYLDEPLRKIGEYADYLYYNDKKLTTYISKGVIDETVSINKFINITTKSAFYVDISNLDIVKPTINYNVPILSPTFEGHFCGGGNTEASWTKEYQISASISDTYKRVCFTLPNTISTVEECKEWLKENPINFYYQLAAPTEELISLPTLKTFKGTTVMSVNTSVLPSNIKTKYVRL